MASLMAARWVGQNSGPVYRHLWTKLHRIKFACAGVSVVCNDVFIDDVLLRSGIFAIKSRSCAKSRRNFDVFVCRQILGEGATQISDRIL